jgi:hypothetical protein
MAKKKKINLKAKLDRLYSLYLRQSEANQNGFITCYCGKKVHWTESDCSHYIPRGCLVLRYDPRNTKASCRKCNRFMGGNLQAYSIYLEEKWGEGILQILEKERRVISKYFPYEAKIAEYEEKIKLL